MSSRGASWLLGLGKYTVTESCHGTRASGNTTQTVPTILKKVLEMNQGSRIVKLLSVSWKVVGMVIKNMSKHLEDPDN